MMLQIERDAEGRIARTGWDHDTFPFIDLLASIAARIDAQDVPTGRRPVCGESFEPGTIDDRPEVDSLVSAAPQRAGRSLRTSKTTEARRSQRRAS